MYEAEGKTSCPQERFHLGSELLTELLHDEVSHAVVNGHFAALEDCGQSCPHGLRERRIGAARSDYQAIATCAEYAAAAR